MTVHVQLTTILLLLTILAPVAPAFRTVSPIVSVALPGKRALMLGVSLRMPPPTLAELPLKVLLVTVSVAGKASVSDRLKMPPPSGAELPLKVLLVIATVPRKL